MHLTIEGVHVSVTPALQSYTEEKMQKLFRHFQHITNISIILSLENLEQVAEATVNVPGDQIFAVSKEENMYKAVDALQDKLDKQLVKFKEKIKNHRLSPAERANERAA